MGRYVNGDAGFEYKYLFGKQDSNLAELDRAPGRPWSVPCFAVTSDAREETKLIPLMPILRAAVAATDDETDLDDFVTGSDAAYGAFEHIVGAVEACFGLIAAHFDAACPWAADRAHLEMHAHYEIRRSDWEPLRRWIAEDRLQDDELKLDMLKAAELPEHLLTLCDVDDALPFLALRILHHAVRHDLETLHVWESDPGRWTNERFWNQCGEEFDDREDAESAFASALITHFLESPRARHEFEDAVKRGSVAAERWLAHLNGSPRMNPPARQPPIEVRTPRLAALIARKEAAAEYRSASRGSDISRRVRAIEAAAKVTYPHLDGEILNVVAEEGSVEEARAALKLIPKLDDETRETEGFYVVRVALRAGDHAMAFDWLRDLVERAEQSGDEDTLASLREDPELEPLRSDPRWAHLLK
jgi:hypothetical protein